MIRNALIAAVLLAPAAPALAAPPPPGSTYVAMGSSYAAGPGITQMAPDSPGLCGQSVDNYARQIARTFKLTLIDRSCSGATTEDILGQGPTHRPQPQLDGLTPDTRLVTITIGGNDVRYMADFSVGVCQLHPDAVPEAQRARACNAPTDFSLDAAFATTGTNLRAIAAEVHRRSPQARLVFVDYVTVLPPGPPCAAVPIPPAAAADLSARAERLAKLTAQVAKDTHADLIKASDLTRDHDACAVDPWTAGYVTEHAANGWSKASFHPMLPAMTAIAQALTTLLQK